MSHRFDNASHRNSQSGDARSTPRRVYAGACHNSTADVTANLLIVTYGVPTTKVYGELLLFGDLGGAGPFVGELTNDTVRFATCLPELQMSIAWTGVATATGFDGHYVVESEHPELITGGLGQQEGVWACACVSRFVRQGVGSQGGLWVFHEGEQAGPLTEGDLLVNARKGIWPPHAIVLTGDGSSWISVQDFIAHHELHRVSQN